MHPFQSNRLSLCSFRSFAAIPNAVSRFIPGWRNKSRNRKVREMKLQQNQVWQTAEGYLRITRLERLAVEYKLIRDLRNREGTHHQVTKKEFCRLLKGAVLLSQADIDAAINLP